MEEKINKIITDALLVNKDNLKKETIKNIIEQIKTSLNNNKEAISQANRIDEKNSNGFIMNFDIVNKIFNNIENETIYYGDVTLSQKDDEKNIIYGKQIMDKGNVIVVSDGNPYIIIEMIARNIIAGNTTIITTKGYMFGTNEFIVQIVQNVLERLNVSKHLVQICPVEEYEYILNNFANIDLVIGIGDHNLQRLVLERSKNETIISGYENFDLYIEDNTHQEFIKEIVNSGINIQVYQNSAIEFDYEDSIIVDDIDEAIGQINYNGNRYSTAIFTNNTENASKFIKEVKSSMVTVNASPTIERIIDIKQSSLITEKTIVYPINYKFDGNTENINLY